MNVSRSSAFHRPLSQWINLLSHPPALKRALLAHAADSLLDTDTVETLCLRAVLHQNVESFQHLVNHRPVANSALWFFAAGYGETDILIKLLKVGACVNAVDETGSTALHHLGQNGLWAGMIRLTEQGACWSLKNKAGETPGDLFRRQRSPNTQPENVEHQDQLILSYELSEALGAAVSVSRPRL